jgi:hypothetical protein
MTLGHLKMALGFKVFALIALFVQGDLQDLQTQSQCKWQASWTNITLKPVCLYEYEIDCPDATYGNMKQDLCDQCAATDDVMLQSDVLVMCHGCDTVKQKCSDFKNRIKQRTVQLEATPDLNDDLKNWKRGATVAYEGCFERGSGLVSYDTASSGKGTQGEAQAVCRSTPKGQGAMCKMPVLVEYPCDDCFEEKGLTGNAGQIPFLMKECCDRCLQFADSLAAERYPEFSSVKPFVYCQHCNETAQNGIFKEDDLNKYKRVSYEYAAAAMDDYIDRFIMPACGDNKSEVTHCSDYNPYTNVTTPPRTIEYQTEHLEFFDWMSYDYIWLVVVALVGMLLGWCCCACFYVCFMCCRRRRESSKAASKPAAPPPPAQSGLGFCYVQ